VAYAFAKLRAPGKNVLFMILLSTMMIPTQITMIPQFVIFSKLGMVNTFWPLILPNFFGHPFNIFLMRQFITQIPSSLFDAARIDGLGFFGIYKSVILPLMKPILIAIGIFTFNSNWAMFLEPLIYLNSPEKMTLSQGVRILTETSGNAAPPWNTVMVTSMLLTIPMLIVFFIGQRYIFEVNFSSGSSSIK
jgi:multiple sugar transport system permease protein